MICKISGIYNRNLKLFWRLYFYISSRGNVDEALNATKREIDFFKIIFPLTKGSQLRIPNVYFIGLDSKGKNSFIQYVLLNSPCKTKSVILMEDFR